MDSVNVNKHNYEWSEIIKPLVEVLTGQSHNQQLQETLSLILQHQAATHSGIPESFANSVSQFYQQQFLLYLQVENSKPKSLFSIFEPAPDPRDLAWEDTQRFIATCLHSQGLTPQSLAQRNLVFDRAINNLTQLIQTNSLQTQDQEKLSRVIEFLKSKVEAE